MIDSRGVCTVERIRQARVERSVDPMPRDILMVGKPVLTVQWLGDLGRSLVATIPRGRPFRSEIKLQKENKRTTCYKRF